MFYRLLLIGILTAGMGFAQRGGGGTGGTMGEEGGARTGNGLSIGNVARTPSRMEIISQSLKLDGNQKKVVKKILDDAQKEANPVHEQLVKSRLAIGDAIQSGKSQDEINQLVKNQAELESQMAGIELQAFAKIYQGLEQQQRSESRALFRMMKGIFDNKNWNNMQ